MNSTPSTNPKSSDAAASKKPAGDARSIDAKSRQEEDDNGKKLAADPGQKSWLKVRQQLQVQLGSEVFNS